MREKPPELTLGQPTVPSDPSTARVESMTAGTAAVATRNTGQEPMGAILPSRGTSDAPQS